MFWWKICLPEWEWATVYLPKLDVHMTFGDFHETKTHPAAFFYSATCSFFLILLSWDAGIWAMFWHLWESHLSLSTQALCGFFILQWPFPLLASHGHVLLAGTDWWQQGPTSLITFSYHLPCSWLLAPWRIYIRSGGTLACSWLRACVRNTVLREDCDNTRGYKMHAHMNTNYSVKQCSVSCLVSDLKITTNVSDWYINSKLV